MQWVNLDKQFASSITEYTRILNLLLTGIYEHQYLVKSASKPLTKTQYTILKLLQRSESFLSSEIADLMQISRAAVSKNIDKLVNIKLVSRDVISKDRRTAKVSLLKAGKIIVEDFENSYTKRQELLFSVLNEQDKKHLASLLDKFVRYCLSKENDIELICTTCNGFYSDQCQLENPDLKCRFQIA